MRVTTQVKGSHRPRHRTVAALLITGALVTGSLGPFQASAASFCTASGAVAVGWGGSRYVPVPPMGIGPSCTFSYSGGYDVILQIYAEGPIGGQVIHRPTGLRYFCRATLEFQLGQNRQAYPTQCSSFGGGLTMRVPYYALPGPGDVYCSSTGELGVLVNIRC